MNRSSKWIEKYGVRLLNITDYEFSMDSKVVEVYVSLINPGKVDEFQEYWNDQDRTLWVLDAVRGLAFKVEGTELMVSDKGRTIHSIIGNVEHFV